MVEDGCVGCHRGNYIMRQYRNCSTALAADGRHCGHVTDKLPTHLFAIQKKFFHLFDVLTCCVTTWFQITHFFA
jgi:hypothetical protein